MYTKALISAVNNFMEENGATRQNVADLCDVPIGTLNRLLSGNTDDIKSITYFKVAKGLNISLDSIAGITDEGSKPSPVPTLDMCDHCRTHGQIYTLNETIRRLTTDWGTQADIYKNLISSLTRDKRILFFCFIIVVAFVFILFSIDLMIPTVGWFRR